MIYSGHPDDEFAAVSIVHEVIGRDFKITKWGQNRYHKILYVGVSPGFSNETHVEALRNRLGEIDWQVITTSERLETESGENLGTIGIAPITFKSVSLAYHATRTVVVPKILSEGMQPSNEEIRVTEFPDTEGLIHVCECLGKSDDELETARWWRGELSRKNRFSDPKWSILRINMSRLQSARVYQDLHSKSGIIIDKVSKIPGCLIERV